MAEAGSPEVGRDLGHVRRVLFAPDTHVDESLIGLVRRCAMENELASPEPLIREATDGRFASGNLAARYDLNVRALAHAMRLPFAQVHHRMHPRLVHENERGIVDFFGASVPLSDLRLSSRCFVPSALASKGTTHHRAIWNHVGVPFDRTSGEHLIDRCPSCGRHLSWGGGGPLTLCNMCGSDARDVRDIRVSLVPHRIVRAVAPITGLLDPDPAVRARDCGGLHSDLLGLDRGGAFELAWRIGRALTATKATSRTAARSLPFEERVNALRSGATILKGWPESLTDCAKRLLACGDPKADRLLRTIHAVSGDDGEWPCLKTLLRRTHPGIVERGRSSAKALNPDHLDGTAAARFLGTPTSRIPLLQKARAIVPMWSGGDTNVHSIFMPKDLEPLRDAIADSASIGTAAEALGIGHHGVEQLIVLGVLTGIDAPGLHIVHKGRRISRRGLAFVLDRLRGLPAIEDGDLVDQLTLRHAMLHVGGREKPWGPVIGAILDGSLIAWHDASRPGAKFIDATNIVVDDLATIKAMDFDRRNHPSFRFTDVMPIRDAGTLLNVNPHGLQDALGGDLQPCVRTGGLAIGPTLKIARRLIGGAEIAARFMAGSRRLPPFLKSGGLARQGPLGWDRQSVERAFGVAS